MTLQPNNDDAMLAYLEGDDDIRAAAAGIWTAAGNLLKAQRDLEQATGIYEQAVASSGLPEAHRERLGAALILRLNRRRLLTELDDLWPEPPSP